MVNPKLNFKVSPRTSSSMCNVNNKLSPPGENSSALMASMAASQTPASASTASNTVTVVVEDLAGSEAQQRGIGKKERIRCHTKTLR